MNARRYVRFDRNKIKKILKVAILIFAAGTLLYLLTAAFTKEKKDNDNDLEVFNEEDFIRWVDFNVSYEALCQAYEIDIETYDTDSHISWIELLAYAAATGGGEFNKDSLRKMEKLTQQIKDGETTMQAAVKDLKYYSYYQEAYQAALGGLVGEYSIEVKEEQNEPKWEQRYGLKGFSPIAKGFAYSDYDDFGSSRSYGYQRQHLGHDMLGAIGTPIIAIESGYVEALGWNQYGGWRIGIRSFDGQRYYYYAHMRQNRPYAEGLEEGSIVTAGDVIGYMGHTGYSTTENVNKIKEIHLHWGLELIFDESQKECDNEIWIDCYALTRFLWQNRSGVIRDEATKEWYRERMMLDPAVEEYKKENALSN